MPSPSLSFITLPHAIGTIQPDDTQQERLDEFTDRMSSGEFLRPTDATVISDCIDGRVGTQGALRPNAAGGSETLMVADDLTSKIFCHANHDTTREQYAQALDYLDARAYNTGGHSCEGVTGTASGCGANDRLPDIYAFIVKHASDLRLLAGALGAAVDGETHQLIVKNAARRHTFSSGTELLHALKGHKHARVSMLKGQHREVVAVINKRERTTLDRDAVQQEFGDNYQAFNVDLWAFSPSANIIGKNTRDTEQKYAAMIYYNLATAHVLVGSGLRVVVVN